MPTSARCSRAFGTARRSASAKKTVYRCFNVFNIEAENAPLSVDKSAFFIVLNVLNEVRTNKRCPMKIYHFFENLLKYFSSFLSMRGVYFLSDALKIKCKIISNTMNKAKYPPIVIA